jgi:hypothetical protein
LRFAAAVPTFASRQRGRRAIHTVLVYGDSEIPCDARALLDALRARASEAGASPARLERHDEVVVASRADAQRLRRERERYARLLRRELS